MLKLSIIVPIYNVEPYLRKCVESLLPYAPLPEGNGVGQDLSPEEYEIILVDDGSTDGSGALADEYAQTLHPSGGSRKGANIRVIHQENAGVAVARNNGVRMAKGRYVAFLDADDWWTPDHARKMLALAERYPDAGIYACRYWYVKNGRNENRIRNIVWNETDSINDARCGYINYFRSYYEGGAMPIWTGCAMLPKEVYMQMDGFPKGIKLGEDFLLWTKVAMQHKVAYLDECLAYYNNDVPATLRATRNLHAPSAHMLFNLQQWEDAEQTNTDWKHLIDKLRVGGLLAYWMDSRYHDTAAAELAKVDWVQQPSSAKRMYQLPICVLKAKHQLLRLGSYCKQKMIRR